MQREQANYDFLPPELGSGLDVSSARLLDSRNSRKYWAVFDEAGEICLIVGFNIGRPDWSAGKSCSARGTFQAHGLSVVAKGDNHFSGAIFVPDGYTENLVDAFPDQYIAENLVAFDSLNSLNDSIGLQKVVIVQSVAGDKPDIELQILR